MKWLSSVKDFKMEKCTDKEKKDNFGPQLMNDKVQSTFHPTNTEIQMINQMIKQIKMKSSLMNVQEQEMDQKKQYFGRYF